jgi:hypothetical protein
MKMLTKIKSFPMCVGMLYVHGSAVVIFLFVYMSVIIMVTMLISKLVIILVIRNGK